MLTVTKMRNILLMLVLVFSSVLTACTTQSVKELVGHGMANAADTKVGYNPTQCFTVRQACQGGDFQQWQTSDGVDGCSCKM